MPDLIIPTIGSSGYFELRSPFDVLIKPNERYTCQALRKLSDYLANNEKPKTDIYDKYTISEVDYDSDIAADMYVVSLQSEKGHWLYVPARYIIKYPIVNGIPYRSMMIALSLPPLPADRDLSFLETDMKNLVADTLGVVAESKVIETSRVVLVAKNKHDLKQAERSALSNGKVTDRSRYMSLVIDHNNALTKIAQLENYIKDNIPATP